MEKNKSFIKAIIIIVIITTIAVFAGIRLNWEKAGPDEVVYNFYNWYFNYEGSALLSEAYKESDLLTETLIKKAEDDLINSKGLIIKDPFTCFKDSPTKFIAYNPVIEKNNATVTLIQYFDEEMTAIKINLKKEEDNWKLDNIICPEGNG